jgi:hypothetical protein
MDQSYRQQNTEITKKKKEKKENNRTLKTKQMNNTDVNKNTG